MSNLQPTPIVDKNGKQTTVHKRADAPTAGSRLNSIGTPAITNTTPRTAEETPIPPIGGSTELARYDFETSEIYEDTTPTDDGEVLYSYSDEYDYTENRAPYLAGEDGIAAVATSIEGESDGYHYSVKLSMFDGNRGNYRNIEVPFFTGKGWTHAPSVGDVVGSLAEDAFAAEQYPLTPEGVKDFAENYGYEPDEDPYSYNEDGIEVYDPMKSARELLGQLHEGAKSFKELVGDVRYGDYVFGRYKADYGYDSGITYAPAE